MNDLGLYISKYVCKQFNGDIIFKNTATSESRYTFEINIGC